MSETFLYRNASGQMVQWPHHSFSKHDLKTLDGFLCDKRVIPLIGVKKDGYDSDTVGMRHDVDHSIAHALKFALWEAQRGYQSTYFILHTAWYYEDFDRTLGYASTIQGLGHEIGFHNDSISEAVVLDEDNVFETAFDVMLHELERWREKGFQMLGCADHGGGYPELQTDFWNIYTPDHFGFEYEAYQLSRGENYISDNRGVWRAPLETIEGKQTHMLVHPCHWPVGS